MKGTVRPIRVFVASPGDVQRERDSLLGVINELNRALDALVPRAAIRLELVRWETDTFPEMGRLQGTINKQIGEYDIFIGILWKRFGTPTGKAASGTEEEFRIAYRRWKRHRSPIILFYFSNAAIAPPRSREEVRQLQKVVEFRAELARLGLTWEYESDALFMNTVRPHLTRVIGRLIRESGGGRVQPRHTKAVAAGLGAARTTVGGHVELTEIGREDACYLQRSKYIGHTGVLMEAQPQGEWLSGTIRFDAPLFEDDDGVYSFLQFQVQPAASSKGRAGGKAPGRRRSRQ